MTQFLSLPDRPSLAHLRKQAYDIQRQAVESGTSMGLADAYHELARRYQFASWPKLKAHVEFLENRPLQAIVEAIRAGQVSALRALLSEHPDQLPALAPTGYTLLHYATEMHAENNAAMAEVVAILLDAGLPVDITKGHAPDGETPLHFAAMRKGVDRVELLLDRGADLRREFGGAGGTPLSCALFYGIRENAEALARRQIDPLNLRSAAGLGRIDLMESLVRPDGSLEPQASNRISWYRVKGGLAAWVRTFSEAEVKWEAMMWAALGDRIDAMDWLVQHGAEVNGRYLSGSTALHWAALGNRRAVVDFLLDHNADVDVRDQKYNGYPWGWAGQNGHIDLERYLLSKSEKLDVFQACNFATSIDQLRAILDRDPQAAHAHQGEPNSCGRNKRGTALHEAVDWFKPDHVELLLSRGADINAKTADGLTPLAIAIRNNNGEAIKLLQSRGGAT